MSFKTLIYIICLVMLTFGTARGGESSILFLPANVEAPNGEVSLYADYGSIDTSGRLPVYFVNRSNHPITLNAQDGDIYLKLEYQDSNGQWVRAQPHYYSFCGNSYMYRPTVSPNHFLVVSGYQPINGERQNVRYRLHSQEVQLVTNVGQGVIAFKDIELASRDDMAISEGDFALVSSIALSNTTGSNDGFLAHAKRRAISELASGRFDVGQSRTVLEQLLMEDPESAEVVNSAIRRLNRQSSASENARDTSDDVVQ